jgi:uncharacterized membrane protein YczE
MIETRDADVSSGILVSSICLRHPRTVAWVRIVVALWLLTLAGIFCSRGGAGYWGAALVAPAAVNLWLACRLRARVHGQH